MSFSKMNRSTRSRGGGHTHTGLWNGDEGCRSSAHSSESKKRTAKNLRHSWRQALCRSMSE